MEKNETEKYQENNTDNITNYINNFGKEIGLTILGFDENNYCCLNFDKKILVHILYKKQNNQCTFSSPLCNITDNNLENFYRQLLISNSFHKTDVGSIIGIEDKTNSLYISYTFIASTFSYEMFKTILFNFVDLVGINKLKYETKEYEKYDKLIIEGKYLNEKLKEILNEKEKEKDYNYMNKYDLIKNINNLGKALHFSDLTFDQNNICTIIFDKKIKVNIIYNKIIDKCIFSSPIHSILKNIVKNFLGNYLFLMVMALKIMEQL